MRSSIEVYFFSRSGRRKTKTRSCCLGLRGDRIWNVDETMRGTASRWCCWKRRGSFAQGGAQGQVSLHCSRGHSLRAVPDAEPGDIRGKDFRFALQWPPSAEHHDHPLGEPVGELGIAHRGCWDVDLVMKPIVPRRPRGHANRAGCSNHERGRRVQESGDGILFVGCDEPTLLLETDSTCGTPWSYIS